MLVPHTGAALGISELFGGSRLPSYRMRRLAAALVIATTAFAAQPAAADTASELEEARAKVAAAQAEANFVAAEISEAQARFESITARIGDLQITASNLRARVVELQTVVRQRAVAAYVHGANGNLGLVMSAGDVVTAVRRKQLLDRANASNLDDVEALNVLREDLAREEAELSDQRAAQMRVRQALDDKREVVEENLATVSQARDELIARLERERAAAAAAELARLQAQRAASQVRSDGGGGAGQVITNPGGGSFQCPLAGSAYSANYGPRGGGFHYGIDMLASSGVPEVAVKSGTVSYVPMGGAGGNEAYLAADDGNVYYYAHMSAFVGPPRRVLQGEVIGLVGSTGNSSTPHLHFEIRIGGPNGQRIDPFPSLQAAGC